MRFRPLGLALIAPVLVVSCSRKDRGVQRIAIPRFENLAAAPGLDWMSRGFAEAVRLQLSGVPDIVPVPVSSLRDAPAVGASAILEGRFSLAGGRLRVDAVLEDAAGARAMKDVGASGPASAGMLPLARSIARQIDPGARSLPTTNPQAFQAYIAALEAGGTTDADGDFQRALSADPDFGAAYLAWVESLLAHGDRNRAMQVLASAHDRVSRLPGVERARLDLVTATLAGDRAAQRRALLALTRADPADASVYRQLGDLDAAEHSYRDAAASYEQAVQREPGNGLLLNQLGYLRAWAGDFDGAVKAVERYRSLQPNEANPLDTLGDVNYFFGRFAEAEQSYRAAYAKNPAFLSGGELYKAAWAKLMQGDLKGADGAFAQFLDERKRTGDSLAVYRQAQWEYLTGRRQQAVARLEQFAQAARPVESSFCYGEMAIWALDAGDRQHALRYASKASGPLPLAALARFLSEPAASSAEWTARAAQAFPAPDQAGVRRLALAYALLYSREFAAAVEPLQQIYDATGPASPDWPAVPLAWALTETGQFDRVPQLLSGNQAPDPTGENPLLSLSFPRVLRLRSLLADRQGQHAQAANYLKLFLRYSAKPSEE